ncbi:MAG TPA: hypothetical protein VNN20_03170 [Thermodesulfobacteriota bacterium]|nr:hypothetical protein [Thermodesulfobacteriota bacterium]
MRIRASTPPNKGKWNRRAGSETDEVEKPAKIITTVVGMSGSPGIARDRMNYGKNY